MKKIIYLIVILCFAITSINASELKSIKYIYYLSTDFPEKAIDNLKLKTISSGGFVKYYD